MTYVKQTWADGVLGGTPLSASRLNYIEDGIFTRVSVNELPRSPLQSQYGGEFTSAAVTAALAGGAAVHLPPTTCVNASITVPAGAIITGVPGKTVLQAAAGASTDVLTSGGSFTVEGVTIDGNKSSITSGSSGYGMMIGHDGVTVRRCVIKNSRLSGIRTYEADDILIENNRFENCGDAGQGGAFLNNAITIQGHNTRILNNFFTGSAGQCVGQSAASAGLSSELIVHGNTMLNSGTFGVALGNYPTKFKVTDNYIDGAGTNCIDTGSALYGLISNNICLNAVSDGIDIDATGLILAEDEVGLFITGNRCVNSGRYGIVVFLPSAATGVTISNNQIDIAGWHGISTSNLRNAIISNNTLRNFGNVAAGYSGIMLAGVNHNNLIQGNNIFEDRVTPQGYGYNEFAGGTYTNQTLLGNDFSRCGVPYGVGTASSGPNTGDIRVANR